jgi:CubicO group peptidase (beta-lactamase class C family)
VTRPRLLRSCAITVAIVASIFGARAFRNAMHVASGYAAKLTCSLSLNSALAADRVRRDLLDHALAPLGAGIVLHPADCCARASVLGLAESRAVWRRGFGCTLLAGKGEREIADLGQAPEAGTLDAELAWPLGDKGPDAPADPAVEAAIDEAFREPLGKGVRRTLAVVVVHRGRLLAERYAEGITAATPMLSWSMAKSVLAALVGIAVSEGRLALGEPAAVPEWSAPGDPRRAITLDHLLRMSSGLRFDETYGAINDVSRMLFTEPDMAAFAAGFPADSPPDAVWSYSSGTSNIVARLLLDRLGGEPAAFVRFAREKLFEPASMPGGFFEHDATGTPVGSSFVFLTPRDWARFGELHLRDGLWQGRRVLPEGWVQYVTTPTPKAPQGRYGAHWWLNGGDSVQTEAASRPWPLLPADAYAARGYSGQWVLVVPSRELVLVRHGASFPDDGDDGTEALAATLLRALPPSEPR